MAMGPILGAGRRGRRTPMAEINVTPMVDVMLVLLIIFMVSAPLLTVGVPIGVQVDVPESKAAALEQSGAPLALSIDAQGRIFLDDQPVAPGALGPLLRQRAAGSRETGGPRVFLRADRSLDYGRVMSVMGEINRAGLRRVALVSTGSGDR
jgi:biopolymer transport protein TolR